MITGSAYPAIWAVRLQRRGSAYVPLWAGSIGEPTGSRMQLCSSGPRGVSEQLDSGRLCTGGGSTWFLRPSPRPREPHSRIERCWSSCRLATSDKEDHMDLFGIKEHGSRDGDHLRAARRRRPPRRSRRGTHPASSDHSIAASAIPAVGHVDALRRFAHTRWIGSSLV